jgi:hypothetical protein
LVKVLNILQLKVVVLKKKANNEFYELFKAECEYCKELNSKGVKSIATAFIHMTKILVPEIVLPCPVQVNETLNFEIYY